jgi:spermidine dehydrogenase
LTIKFSGSEEQDPVLSAQERELGMDRDITRRDFVNTLALGTGAALLDSVAPGLIATAGAAERDATEQWHPWTGYGGVGDYAVSNGNTWDVVSAGHGIRDSQYERSIADASATGESYDLVIVGGGFSGVIAAHTFLKVTNRKRRCLILDNHPLIGGEAKRNEFIVRGQRLIGPQGSNDTSVPTTGWAAELWRDVGLPVQFEFAQMPAGRRSLELPLCNFDGGYLWEFYPFTGKSSSHGYYFDTPHPHWVTDPWQRNFEDTPWPEDLRRDLLRWRDEPVRSAPSDESVLNRWLDSMTYDEYLTKFRKLHPGVARYTDRLLAAGTGPASDVASAYLAYFTGFPGFKGLPRERSMVAWLNEQTQAGASTLGKAYAGRAAIFSFPSGNDGIMRALVKSLNPDVIEGSGSFADAYNGKIRFEAMDREDAPCRMRSGATVIRVEPDSPAGDGKAGGKPSTVTYIKDGKLFSLQARTLIWAGSSWTAKHVVQQLPSEYQVAMESFPRSPMLVVNVALNNWRALYKLGYTTCTWQSGFGFTANIRAPMYIGNYRPPLDPDQPTILTFYVPFPQYGLSLAEQGKVARAKLFATSYREFETQIRKQLMTLFGSAGFDATRDIAGIVLNRWGHAYVNAGPGFFFGRDGKPAPRDVLRRPLGNLAFAHSELAGLQLWEAAGEEGMRAARQILEML